MPADNYTQKWHQKGTEKNFVYFLPLTKIACLHSEEESSHCLGHFRLVDNFLSSSLRTLINLFHHFRTRKRIGPIVILFTPTQKMSEKNGYPIKVINGWVHLLLGKNRRIVVFGGFSFGALSCRQIVGGSPWRYSLSLTITLVIFQLVYIYNFSNICNTILLKIASKVKNSVIINTVKFGFNEQLRTGHFCLL